MEMKDFEAKFIPRVSSDRTEEFDALVRTVAQWSSVVPGIMFPIPERGSFPTLREVRNAIPEQGIDVKELTAMFMSRVPIDRRSAFAMLLRAAAKPSVDKPGVLIRKSWDGSDPVQNQELVTFPTLEEIRNAIPKEGISWKALFAKFRSRVGDRIGDFVAIAKDVGFLMQTGNTRGLVFRKLKDNFPTVQEVRSAIPISGIRLAELFHFYEFQTGSRGGPMTHMIAAAGRDSAIPDALIRTLLQHTFSPCHLADGTVRVTPKDLVGDWYRALSRPGREWIQIQRESGSTIFIVPQDSTRSL